MKIGDPIVMVSGDGEREAMPAFLYVYIEDTDETYRRAIGAAESRLRNLRTRLMATDER
jgi:PhnB protein